MTDLVFFNPDNGLEVRSYPKGQKRSSKYVFGDELADHYQEGQSALIYQHFPRVARGAFINCRNLVTREDAQGVDLVVWRSDGLSWRATTDSDDHYIYAIALR